MKGLGVKKGILLFLIGMLVLSGCNKTQEVEETDENVSENSEMFTDRDTRITYDEDEATIITLKEDEIKVDGEGASVSDTTLTIQEEGCFIVRGSMSDGMIIVDSNNKAKIQIVLDGVNLTSSQSAPIYVKQADKVFITLAEESENTLENGGSFSAIDENDIDAVIFSKDDLTLNGLGKLTISSPAGHGIVSKDDLVLATEGTYAITCASSGLNANDSIRIRDVDLSISSGKDGMHAENSEDSALGFIYVLNGTISIDAQGDGMSASSYMHIIDGDFAIVCGGGYVNGEVKTSSSWGDMPNGRGGMKKPNEPSTPVQEESDEDSTSMKGLKSTGKMTLENGVFVIDSADDSIHANEAIVIKNGSYTLSSGDDGIHADADLNVVNGTINVTTSYEGLEGLTITVDGGDISIEASDDGFNAAGGTDNSGQGGRGGDPFASSSDSYITINDGNILIHASGDGIDSNGAFSMNGGNVTISGPVQGDTSIIDYGEQSEGVITGGTFIGTGASSMAQTFTSGEQGILAFTTGNQQANTLISILDTNGKEVLSYTSDQSFNCVIISTSDLTSGTSYNVNVGSLSGTLEAY